MNELLNDLQENILGYYDDFVALVPKLAMAAFIFALLFVVARYLGRFTQRRLNTRLEDPLLARFLARLVRITVLIFALLIVLKIIGLGAAAAGLLGTASVGAFVIGFAFKDIGEHFLAGIMLAFNRPFRVGDTVELDGIKGKVLTLSLRNTHLKSFDGKDIYIPNGNIVKNPVVNYTIDGYIRHEFDIGLDYGSDVNKAMKIVLDVLSGVPGILQEDKKPSVAITSLASSTLNLTAYFWLDTFDDNYSASEVKTQAVDQVLQALDKAGFYLPGDIIELKNFNNSALHQKAQ